MRHIITSHLNSITIKTFILALFAIWVSVYPLVSRAAEQLELVQAYDVMSDFDSNPSGLAFCNGQLLTVSDKRDGSIYTLEHNPLSPHSFDLKEYKELSDIPKLSSALFPFRIRVIHWLKSMIMADNIYDWEGIACDDDSNLYLLSESYAKVLIKFADDAEVSKWLDADFYQLGVTKGLFNKDNAFAEGVAVSSIDDVYLAAERQPRGLLTSKNSVMNVVLTESSPIPPRAPRSDDYSGLTLYNDSLYTLERNASAVCQLDTKKLTVNQCWSYAHIENDSEYRYENADYGLGEGIVFAMGYLWIIFDNNGSVRVAQNNNFPLLLQFKLPKQ